MQPLIQGSFSESDFDLGRLNALATLGSGNNGILPNAKSHCESNSVVPGSGPCGFHFISR